MILSICQVIDIQKIIIKTSQDKKQLDKVGGIVLIDAIDIIDVIVVV